jgi:hypothetical protein
MATFLFSYRVPADYTPGDADQIEPWLAWFESMGASVVDRGNPIFESTTLGTAGTAGADTKLGGYSLVSADDLEAAVALAKGCPALDIDGGGVEVGAITIIDH